MNGSKCAVSQTILEQLDALLQIIAFPLSKSVKLFLGHEKQLLKLFLR